MSTAAFDTDVTLPFVRCVCASAQANSECTSFEYGSVPDFTGSPNSSTGHYCNLNTCPYSKLQEMSSRGSTPAGSPNGPEWW